MRIGIIGFGNMGSAIAQRIKTKWEVAVFDKERQKTQNLSGIHVAQNIEDLLAQSGVMILAVKPQDFDGVLAEIKDSVGNKLVVSIVAGISTEYIEKFLGQARVVRAMPNLPAKIGKGMSCLCKGKSTTEEDLNLAEGLFDNLGKTLIIKEEMMDAATAISGSGPGYFFDSIQNKNSGEIGKFAKNAFIPTLITAAEKIGFSRPEAELLTQATVEGSMELLKKTQLTPLELRNQVASKGGTTEAGLEVLHIGGSLEEAVEAAKKRAGELSKIK